MILPESVSKIIYEILQGAVEELGEKLLETTGTLPNSDQPQSNAPALPETIQNDSRYTEAMVAYWQRQADREQQLNTNPELSKYLKSQQLQEQQELSQLRRNLIRELQANEITLKLEEISQTWHQNQWFAQFNYTETEQILQQAQHYHRLLILVAPPQISQECPISFQHHFPLQISNQVNSFLSQYYPISSNVCPVEFYGDYFPKTIEDSDVQRLQTVLTPIPTSVLYSTISDYNVNFYVSFWGVNRSSVAVFSLPEWNWEQTKKTLETAGYSKQEAHGTIGQIMVTIHQLLAAFVADWYYLNIDSNYQPQLLALESKFERSGQSWGQPYIQALQQIQQAQMPAYQRQMQQLGEAAFEKIKGQNNWQCDRTISGYLDAVYAVEISPDSQILAIAGQDNTIKILQLKTSNLIRTFSDHSLGILTLCINPNGEIIASGSRDKTIKIWELKTGKLLNTLKGHSDWVCSVKIAPDGSTLVSVSRDKTAKVWDLKTGKVIRTIKAHLRHIDTVAIAPDGMQFITGSYDDTAKIWELNTDKLIHTLEGHTNWVKSVAMSQDGHAIITGSSDNTLKIWELSTGNLIRTLAGHDKEINTIAVSPDGQTIISGSSDRALKIWELRTGKLIRTLTGHTDSIVGLAISPDGKTIVTGSADKSIKIWRCP